MKRQVLSCLFILLALCCLFLGGDLANFGWRSVTELLPGGIQVSYFSDADDSAPVCSRTERKIWRDYASGEGFPRGATLARWEGVLTVPVGGTYQFYLQSKGGSRMYIDGQLVVDRWHLNDWVPGSGGEIDMTEGEHGIVVEHRQMSGESAIRLRWYGGPIPANTVVSVPHLRKK